MNPERNTPARGGGTVHLDGEQSPSSKNTAEKQGISGAPLHLIGSPTVAVTHHCGSTFVTVENPLWGWGNLDREFLHPKSRAADKYAAELRERIAAAAWKEHGRIERLKEARRREREATVGRIGGAR